MKTAAIKIKTYASNVNVIDNNDLRKRILHTMLLVLALLVASYVFIIGSTVFNIVERKSLSTEASNLSSEVRELELTYLSMSSKIDLDLSHSLGFKEVNVEYATRKSLGSLGFVQNEI